MLSSSAVHKASALDEAAGPLFAGSYGMTNAEEVDSRHAPSHKPSRSGASKRSTSNGASSGTKESRADAASEPELGDLDFPKEPLPVPAVSIFGPPEDVPPGQLVLKPTSSLSQAISEEDALPAFSRSYTQFMSSKGSNISSKDDLNLYQAIRALSILKQCPATTEDAIGEALNFCPEKLLKFKGRVEPHLILRNRPGDLQFIVGEEGGYDLCPLSADA